jgi:C4-type Zn-finger protein
MKFLEFESHKKLLREWQDYIAELSEKHKEKKSKEKKHPKIRPSVIDDEKSVGLRVDDDSGNEYTIAAVDDATVVLQDPEGTEQEYKKTDLSRFKLD